jgi:hypothetical protein
MPIFPTDHGDALFWLLVAECTLEILLLLAWWVGMTGAFRKASRPAWAALIPVYNYCVLAQIAGRSWWWGLLSLVPCLGLIFLIVISIDVARAFGRSGAFAVGLFFLPFVFYPILGFGKSKYLGAQLPPIY